MGQLLNQRVSPVLVKQALLFLVVVVFCFSQLVASSVALSKEQKKIFAAGVNYFNTCETGSTDDGAPKVLNVGGSISINGPYKSKAYPGDNIKAGYAYKGNASTYGSDPKKGYVDPGDVDSSGKPLGTASGISNAQPGIAVYNSGSLKGWWKVIAPNGKSAILQQTDVGPSTARIVDINTVAARTVFGYKGGDSFPTDQGQWKIEYVGKTKPDGAISDDNGQAGTSSSGGTNLSACECQAKGSSGGASSDGTNSAGNEFNFLVTTGKLDEETAAAITGNNIWESGGDQDKLTLNPKSVNSIGATGIAQWYQGRADALHKFAQKKGKKWYDLDLQLDYLLEELHGSQKASLDATKAASGIANKTTTFEQKFEVSGDTGSYPIRITLAKKVLNKFGGGKVVPGSADDKSSADTCGDSSGSASIDGYKNPFRDIKNLGRGRIDSGVDYTGSGPIYAIGKGKVMNLKNSGWPGGYFILYKLLDGPAKGKFVYFAENCPAKVKIGDEVTSETVICDMINASPHIETGWADGSAPGNALAHSVYVEGHATAYGVDFSKLLKKLGAPGGTYQYPGEKPLGSVPSDWPKW